MDIVTLPVTGNNQAIQENFLQELSQRVNIKGNAVDRKIQILIFKPAGRPQEEFDDIIQVFKETGRRLDKNLIFITATKPDRCKFEVPSNFNFALQTCVFLNDENEIDPMSSDAMHKVADHLKRKYGLQPYTHENRMHGAVLGADEEQRKKLDALKQENKRLKQYVEEKVQEGHGHQREIECLKESVKEQRQKNDALKQENERLKLDVETKVHLHRREIECLKESVEEQRQKNYELKQENERLKLDVDGKGQKEYGHQGERKYLKRSGLKEHGQGGRMREIRFKHEEKSSLPRFLSRGEQMYSVNVHAVEEELTKIEHGHYDFQRKYEEKFHLEPGRLRRVLEYIEEVLKNLSGDNLILEGERFQNLTSEVDKTFWLSADRFLEFLIQIHERNVHAK